MLDAVKREQEYRAAEGSLMAFMRLAFPIIEPGVQFKDNWHLHAIAAHLEAVSAGEINNLIIAIPPGCMKSILVSVAWPAWEWIQKPWLRWFGASYGEDLAIRDAAKCRDILISDWYSERWGSEIQIKRGADQKTKYETIGGGWRMASSVGGRATGEHPDRKIIDDPHNAKQAESDAERQGALDWYDRTISTRGLSRGARTVLVAQRFHEKDLTGHILADHSGFDYLCIPMEFEQKRKATSIGWVDPRKKAGELLWPEMFPAKTVATLKVVLGSYGSSGQLQQTPSPGEGGILDTKHFQMWPADLAVPDLEFVLQSYDGAYTEDTQNDPTACTVWGVFHYRKRRHAILLDAWAEHLSYPKLRNRVKNDYTSEYYANRVDGDHKAKARRPDRVLIEEKSSGISLIQDMRLAQVPVVAYNPGRADKVARAHLAAPLLEMDVIWIPESRKKESAGQMISWSEAFIRQCKLFPQGEHDDYVDTFTQAILYLKNSGWLTLPTAKELDEPKPPPKASVNPYAQ